MSAEAWRVRVDGPIPSVNHMYRIVRDHGKMTMAKTSEASTYQVGVALQVRTAKPSDWKAAEKVIVNLWFHMQHRRDVDNALKCLLDGAAHGLGINDVVFLPRVMDRVSSDRDWVEMEFENMA